MKFARENGAADRSVPTPRGDLEGSRIPASDDRRVLACRRWRGTDAAARSQARVGGAMAADSERVALTAEGARLAAIAKGVPWRRWGPYLSERQWGTVREDYSAGGDAWDYLPHDHARSRAYRWGEDGLAGICDDRQRLCLALALWNGKDPFLKERLFGLSNGEGNHGEDVKEVYHYVDALPSHAYNRMVYRYPQRAFPYAELVARNAERGRHEPEFELADTGIFEGDAYFD